MCIGAPLRLRARNRYVDHDRNLRLVSHVLMRFSDRRLSENLQQVVEDEFGINPLYQGVSHPPSEAHKT